MKLKRNQKGFTLIEVLVVVGILGAIMGVMAMTVVTIMIISPKSNDHVIALRQVQNAGYWISRDVLGAKSVTPDNDPAAPLLLTLIDGNDKTLVYKLEDMAVGTKKLMRTDQDTGGQILIAEYIYYDPGEEGSTKMDYNSDTRTLTATIAATSGEVKVTKQYKATQRVPE